MGARGIGKAIVNELLHLREQVPGLGYPEGGVLGGLFNRERVGQGAGGGGGREPADGSGWRALRCKARKCSCG